MANWNPKANDIFIKALEIGALDRRRSYLAVACGEDSELRSQVDALLSASEQAGGFLQQPAVDRPQTAAFSPSPEYIGTQIGPYKLLQQIGEGGMGTVYMAEQTEPIQRTVALKIIKIGMDSRQVIARFEAERQALALMDHPNIAKMLEAGATDTGQPYFVMELVKGISITSYCDQHQLSTKQRLNLFLSVCSAVQHAHQKGIIHRDLKPNNVLVADYDDRPVAKIIDFGVAKAVGQPLTERTMFTEFGQVIGTVEYMSPEQAKLNQLDIDTRTDIYSLGVLLYELLAGSTPFEKDRLRSAAFDEMLRIIREEEPVNPSTRLSTSLSLPSIAANRHLEPKKLTTLVRGDLDWIVMKSLEKDRTRRYETATGLAEDIQRYLIDQPVEARRPTRGYRLKKFVHRNKVVVLAGSAIALALMLGTVVSTWQALRADSEAKIALDQEYIAKTQAARSEQVAQFLKDMLQGVEPSVAVGRDTTLLREVLDKSAARISKDLKDQPEVEAELLWVIGNTYRAIGSDAQAKPIHREALTIYKRLQGNESPQIASLLNSLAGEVSLPGNNTEAETLERESLTMRRKLLGNEHPQVAESLDFLAVILLRQALDGPDELKQKKLSEAEVLEREALAMRKRLLGGEHVDVAQSLESLAGILQAQGRLRESETMIRDSLAMRKKLLGSENLPVAASLFSLADVLLDQAEFAEAESCFREALAMRRKFCGEEHPDVAIVLAHLAVLLQQQGRLPEAESMNREALTIWRKSLGDGHPYIPRLKSILADVLEQEGKQAEAEKLHHEVADPAAITKPKPSTDAQPPENRAPNPEH